MVMLITDNEIVL